MKKTHIIENIIEDSEIGENSVIWNYAVVFKSKIGKDVSIGSHSEIGKTIIGDRVRIGYGVFTCDGVIIEKDCFISPRVCFTNDKYPTVKDAIEKTAIPLITLVKQEAVIGANCTILPGITIGKNSVIGAGTVVTKDVPDNTIVYGNSLRKRK